MTDRESRRSTGDISLDAPLTNPERDGVGALHDTEAEAGDETELADMFELDRAEARELGVDLDPVDRDERQLD